MLVSGRVVCGNESYATNRFCKWSFGSLLFLASNRVWLLAPIPQQKIDQRWWFHTFHTHDRCSIVNPQVWRWCFFYTPETNSEFTLENGCSWNTGFLLGPGLLSGWNLLVSGSISFAAGRSTRFTWRLAEVTRSRNRCDSHEMMGYGKLMEAGFAMIFGSLVRFDPNQNPRNKATWYLDTA